ncbi:MULTISPECIES: ABC transporter permease [Rhodomicrobium]|uniref:ABC transporter permease n=1 Tax=Rhodomicrobium TaxID=1068 RepID=UPI000B4A7D15|nr:MULTISPECIES: ABC transporter permease [Rhodomicrobium]
MSWNSVLMQRLALVGGALAIWWIGSLGSPSYILPSPPAVLKALISIAGRPTFLEDVGATCFRVFTGFALALLVGVPLGIIFGANRGIGGFFEPVVPILNTVSSAIWAIFAILWFGATDASTIFVVFMTAMPLIMTNAWQGTRSVSRELIEVALSLQYGRAAILRKVYLPSILPYVFSGARLAFGFGWRVSLVAETLGASSGIGYRLRQSADLFRVDQVFAWTFVMIGIMIAIELILLRPLERHLFRWQQPRPL